MTPSGESITCTLEVQHTGVHYGWQNNYAVFWREPADDRHGFSSDEFDAILKEFQSRQGGDWHAHIKSGPAAKVPKRKK